MIELVIEQRCRSLGGRMKVGRVLPFAKRRMIAPGHLADFVLLDKDYFTVAEAEIKSIASVLTVMDGRVVFGAQQYSTLSPRLPEILPVWSPIKYFGGYHGAHGADADPAPHPNEVLFCVSHRDDRSNIF